MPNLCLICGYDFDGSGDDFPWGSEGIDPSYNFCPCCGVEFGYGDATLTAARNCRIRWRESNYEWKRPGRRPADWDPDAQLSQLPERAE